MIESAIITQLETDSQLTGILAKYPLGSSNAAIFAMEAPEDATMPYLVIDLQRSADNDLVVHKFNLFVSYYDREKSRRNSNIAQERIEFALSQKVLQHERYSDIRIWSFSGGNVPRSDPRDIKSNQQFYIRATRKKWMEQL